MMLEIDDIRAWLIELGELESAALLSEAEFEYAYIDTAMRMDAQFADTDIYELSIRVPGRIYRNLGEKYKKHAEQIESAISELTTHTTGSWIRETSWLLRMPKLMRLNRNQRPTRFSLIPVSMTYNVFGLRPKEELLLIPMEQSQLAKRCLSHSVNS